MSNVLMNDECRERLKRGVNLAADVVAVTYGPKGNTVISGNHITKDGLTAVSWVHDEDPYVMMGVNLMKDIARKTVEVAGDGSTTSVLLAREIINNCTAEDIPDLKEGLKETIKYLNSIKSTVETDEDLLKIATISAGGDKEIGKLVASAFSKAGKDGLVTFTESDEVVDSVDYSPGFRIENGYASPGFVNTPQDTCELNDVFVYISDTKLEEAKQIVEIADNCIKKGKTLLLVAPDFDSEIYVFLQSNLNLLQSCCVISPSFKKMRSIMVKDMRILLGEKSICKKVVITNHDTTFLYDEMPKEADERITEIRTILEEGNLKDIELDFHKKRLANFTSGVATINIGGYSQFQIKEKLDRVEDAVRAVDCAVKEGYLIGGGMSLANFVSVNEDSINAKIKNILLFPFITIHKSGAFTKYEDLTMAALAQNLLEEGIIEPFLVTKTALENAINIATTILSCNCAINNNF